MNYASCLTTEMSERTTCRSTKGYNRKTKPLDSIDSTQKQSSYCYPLAMELQQVHKCYCEHTNNILSVFIKLIYVLRC